MIRGLFRMIASWRAGRYHAPWKPIAFAAVLLVYLFSPVDFIPDYIPFVGIIDDVLLLGFFLRSLHKEVTRFLDWEKLHTSSGQPPV